MPAHRNVIKNIPDTVFVVLVRQSSSIASVIRQQGLNLCGAQYDAVNLRMAQLNLTAKDFLKRPSLIGKLRRPLVSLLVDGSVCSTAYLKTRLVEEGVLPYKCNKCPNTGEWQGLPLSLQLEHKNGNSTDNRLENLELLCPNCHSQTATYAGKRPHLKARKVKKERKTKILWPSDDMLEHLIWQKPLTHWAQHFGVTTNAIKHHCLSRSIPVPSNAHWAKLWCPTIPKEEIQQHLKSKSVRAVAKLVGCSHKTLQAYLVRNSIPFSVQLKRTPTASAKELALLVMQSSLAAIARDQRCSREALRRFIKTYTDVAE